jgi:hypothetical protein
MKVLILLKKQLDSVTLFTEKTAMTFLNLIGFRLILILQKGGVI